MSSALTEFPLPTLSDQQINIQRTLEFSGDQYRQGLNLALIFGSITLIFILFSIATLILWIVCFVDILSRDFKNSNDKIVWFLAVLFVPFLGSIVYLLVGKKKK